MSDIHPFTTDPPSAHTVRNALPPTATTPASLQALTTSCTTSAGLPPSSLRSSKTPRPCTAFDTCEVADRTTRARVNESGGSGWVFFGAFGRYGERKSRR